MNKNIDLTKDNISKTLIKLSLPIMGTSFIQMAYNMIDMMWVGKIGSDAVAAVGTAGFFPWLAMAFISISKVGGEVKVSQNIGKKDAEKAMLYTKSSLEINILLAIIYTLVLIILKEPLIGFFNLGDENVISMSENYLIIIALGMIFTFLNPVLTAVFNGMGNSKTPFFINTFGLIVNIILDPLLIFNFELGVIGAAIATTLAQMIVTLSFIFIIIKEKNSYFKFKLFKNIDFDAYKKLIDLGIPVALQNGLFTIIAMIIGVVVASFGPVAIAAQKVGSQIESISWMVCEGIASALSSFIGQNYGAKEMDRVEKGCGIALLFCTALGILNTFLLVWFSNEIFALFINEKDSIEKGASYLTIIGYSQVFMCLEIVVAGIFRGLGKPLIPSVIMIILTAIRIPMAYILSNYIGIDGVWWSLTISSILKGISLYLIFIYMIKTKIIYKDN